MQSQYTSLRLENLSTGVINTRIDTFGQILPLIIQNHKTKEKKVHQ